MVRLDESDRRTLAMLLVGVLLLTLGTLWLAGLLGLAVAIYHGVAG